VRCIIGLDAPIIIRYIFFLFSLFLEIIGMAYNNGSSVVNRETEDPSGASSVDRVSIKVPPFIPTDPELWFLMLEGGFDAAGITQDNTKYGHVLTALDQRYALEVRDILNRPRGERSYELLKTELIKRLGSSREQNTRRLLENEPLGDRKPSQFFRHLRGLAGTEFPEDILQTLWLSRLPRNVQALLAAHRDLTLEKRAEIADSIADLYGPAGIIAIATTPPPPPPAQVQYDGLTRVMIEAVQKLAAIEINTQGQRQPTGGTCETCGRSRSRSRPRSHSRSRSRRPSAASDTC